MRPDFTPLRQGLAMYCYPFRSMALVVALCSGLTSITLADKVATEIREDIEILIRESEEFEERGADDKAAQMRKRIAELERQLEKRMRSQDERAERSPEQRERLLQHVAAGAEALQALGRREDARRLIEVLQQLRRQNNEERRGPIVRRKIRIERREGERERPAREREESRERPRRERSREGEREEHPEIRAARQQAEVLALAAEVLADADRERGADQLQHARRALQMAIEGRRGEEAREIRESAPSREAQAEWLMLASRVLNERGRREQASAVANLAETFQRKRRNTEHREARPEHSNNELRNQVRQLERRLEELQRKVERLHSR